ncbi:hypothetical protein C8J57DRAFT_1642908 [Mycena rebaudengoi]|nr:hypothetical protein C8J57DRAFT_1642908 [Mycena rebaudengoi]
MYGWWKWKWDCAPRHHEHDVTYVWELKVTSENGQEIVITMLPYLAERIHHAKASLHDNTYTRVHGPWKEWEVPGLFETIAHITKSEVKFKFIDGEGLRAILVDGNKPQANALGAYLVTRNRPDTSGICETDPKLILFNILRTCIFHLERKFAEMAKTVSDEPMGRIRRSPYIETQQEIEEFVQWCKNSEYKIVRDWISDKDSIPWFFPSINGFLSAIPEDDWYLTPGDTNLNESAHPFTNQHTGTNLSLLEAIERAYEMDLQIEAKLREMEKTCVLVNHRNTKVHRDRNNVARRTTHYRQALERSEARNELENINDAIQRDSGASSTAKGSSGGEWGEENKAAR